MKFILPDKIDRKQWLLRLAVNGEPSAALEQQMQQAEKKLFEAAVPQGTYRCMSVNAVELPGAAIKRHLAECNEMVFMAVTLGAGVERLIRVSQVRDMAEAVMLDSGASVLTEQICDDFEMHIRRETGGFMTNRFSPGYGDFPVEMQTKVTKVLDTHRQIGLSVNENHILIPRKSITAIAGLADHPVKGAQATCDDCLIREKCTLKKEGKQCWT